VTRLAAFFGLAAIAFAGMASAQPSWIIQEILPAAKAEGEMTIYASMNEEEALPYWKVFEDATGIKAHFVRLSDANIHARIAIEARARAKSWDLVATTPAYDLPEGVLAQFDPPEGKNLISQARGSDRRWYGVNAHYNAPAYNTGLVKPSDLPRTYEDFLGHKEWSGKIAIDATDSEWLGGLFKYYGEERGRNLAREIVTTLKPVVIDGRLNVARAVGAGEYVIALNNFLALTINMKLSGAPTNFWVVEPVSLAFGSVGISTQAPHPNAALLAANYMLSRDAQAFLTRRGRLPTRSDVETNPPGVLDGFRDKKIVFAITPAEERKRMQMTFNEIFRPR
jgi:iron(III) transport system substrate-binding protein